MDLLQTTMTPTDNLTEEKDLATLRSLFQKCIISKKYRNELDELRDDKIGMIIYLWMRDEEIPSHLNLTIDPVIAQGIKDAIKAFLNLIGLIPSVRETPIYRVLKNPSRLLEFLTAYMSMCKITTRNAKAFTKNLDNINQKLELPINPGSIDSKIDAFIQILPTLSPIALVYIAVVGSFVRDYLIMGNEDPLTMLDRYLHMGNKKPIIMFDRQLKPHHF